MTLNNHWLAVSLLSGGASLLLLAAACGDDNDNSEFGSSSSSGSTGAISSGFGGSSNGSSGASGASNGSVGTSTSGFNAEAGACASTNFATDLSSTSFLFIVDRSGSMNCNPPPTTASAFCETHPTTQQVGQPTKWSIQRDALKGAIAALPSKHSAGMTFFNKDDVCAVSDTPDIPVAAVDPTQIALVNQKLDDAKAPFGLTPIVGAVTLGYKHLHTTAAFNGKKKVLVLLTDGAETCRPELKDDFIAKTVKDALSVGIGTFVIGAPGSELNRAFLSQMAWNGGSASSATCKHDATPADQGDCHFDLTNAGDNLATELNQALDTIAKKSLGCEYDVPPGTGAIDYQKVNVLYKPGSGGDQQTIKQDTTAGCDQGANGWQFSEDRTRVRLCGQTCTTVKADPGAQVSIALGCLTESTTK